jgi:MazG family protein|tara:strand:+ start:979 stop:1716 length:738 start_codon:yes stop_codon:yes gene_type:complete
MKEFDELVDIISKLREDCPWDKEQTHESLSKHLIEEAYELLDSLAKLNDEDESFKNLESELGDLLLQVLLHSKIASENGYFSIVGVVDSLNKKLVKRHPHVFGDVKLDSPKEVEKQWEKIKQEDKNSIFDDINKNLPAITTAFKVQRKAESINLSYKNYEEALEDLISEIDELKHALSQDEKKYELGDVLFSLINVSRYIEADPEIQLKKSTERFINRAKYVESKINDNSDIETLWNEAKKAEIE